MSFQVNKMLCMRHGKKIIGKCMWCGKQLCKMCDFKNDGKKFYCSDCLEKIAKNPRLKEKYSGITRKQL